MALYRAVLLDPRSGEEREAHTTAASMAKARSNIAWRIRRSARTVHIASIEEVIR